MRQDLAEIRQLHASSSGTGSSTSLNRRDASNPSASVSDTTKPWKKPPQPIAVPVNPHARPSRPGNPWTSNRMSDTLTNRPYIRPQTHAGNHTASRTVLNGSFSNSSNQPRQSVTSRYYPKNPDAFDKRPAHTPSEPISISDDEGPDRSTFASLGLRSSPDPIGEWHEDEIRPDQRRLAVDSRPGRLNFEKLAAPQRNLPADGPSTYRLAEKLKASINKRQDPPEVIILDDDSSEPGLVPSTETEPTQLQVDDRDNIHSHPDAQPTQGLGSARAVSPVLTGLQQNRQGKVAEQVKRLDGISQAGHVATSSYSMGKVERPSGQVRSSSSKPPHLDLLQMRSAGVKNRMKGKTPAATSDWVGPSGFHSGGKRTKKTSSDFIALPLLEWTLGFQRYETAESQYWFILDKERIEVKQGSPESQETKFSINLRDQIGTVQLTIPDEVSDDGDIPAIIALKTARAKMRYKSMNKSGEFKHGAHGPEGMIGFRFRTKHANWTNGTTYKELVREVKEMAPEVELLRGSAVQRAWECLCNPSVSDELSTRPVSPDSVLPVVDDWGSLSRPLSRADDMDEEDLGESLSTHVRPRTTVRNTSHPEPSTRLTRSTRKALEDGSRSSPPANPDELVLVYPPSGTGAVNITRGDLKRLEPGQYLNDTLIEFGLKLWLNDFREQQPELAEQVHVFNSFFYKKLAVKDKNAGYQSVRKWTSKFDLFQKKYLIVPINEHLHWYLAIICNPEYVLRPPPPEPPKPVSSIQTRKRKRESENEDIVELSGTPDPASVPPERPTGTREPTPARSLSGDEDENRVEAMLDVAVSPAEDTQPDSAPEKSASPVRELDGENGGLLYPMSDQEMDVDAPPREPSVRSGSERGLSEPMSITRPPSAMDQDVDIVEIDDQDMQVDAGDAPSASTVPVSRFYGSTTKRGKERAVSPAVPHPSQLYELEAEQEDAVDAEPESTDFDPNKAYIFTFDSLGGRHPGAIGNLRFYLQMEAQDKKGLDVTKTTPPNGKAAIVPAQPNFCDCGVYLIHFVQTFMKNPRRAMEIIQRRKVKGYSSKEREEDWDAQAVATFRDELRARAESLAELWRQERAAKEEQRRREAAAGGPSGATSEAVDDSDDEIIVGEIISKAKPVSTKGKGKAKATAAAGQTKADRIR